MADQLVKRSKAAALLDCSYDMVRKLQNQGDLPLVHVGRSARVRLSDLYAFIAQSAVQPEHEDAR